jgi:predicted RNA-binding Zn-ribbon protein involved in translation (DUF1610 family)
MMKFRCQSCGHRIAVPPRMIGRLVNCPECGGVTHPLAEQLVGGKPPAEAETRDTVTAGQGRPATAPAHQVRHCDNCGRLIGRLEESHVWQGNLVCVACHAHLRHSKPAAAVKAAALVGGDVQPLKARRVGRPSDDEHAIAPLPSAGRIPPSRLALLLATRPARLLLALCTLALAVYFVYSFLQVIGLLANVVVVGVLLAIALFFLLRPGPHSPNPEAGDTGLAQRP